MELWGVAANASERISAITGISQVLPGAALAPPVVAYYKEGIWMFTLCLALLSAQASPQLTGLDGRVHRPLAESGRHPALVVFISHDCPICNAYAPELRRISTKYRKSHVAVSLVYAEPGLSLEAARAHTKAYSYTGIHSYLDPHGELSKFTGATVTPEAVLYDSAGKLAYRGRIDDSYVAFGKQRTRVSSHDLRVALDAVIAHRKVANARTSPVGCYIASDLK
jgi:thiol-disulfide isomerase/thioredoxin